MLLNSNSDQFKRHFKNKLSEMLSPDELGSFILVLANSMQEENLQQSLSEKLETTFNKLKAVANLKGSEDDKLVFQTLKKTGIKHYTSWQSRQVEHWQCAYNPMRALRPMRASNEQFTSLLHPFDNNAFHFDKAFLRPEIISEENFDGTDLRLMYHKFPFAPFHLLIVIDATSQRAQVLDKKTHLMTWNLANHIGNKVAGFGLSFNSIGAGASINHLHIHGFIEISVYSVEHQDWKHNGGDKQYPLNVERFSSASEAWQRIDHCHQHNQPYNLLYRAGSCYVIQRKPQGSTKLPHWLGSIGWYEGCGGFNLSDESVYQSISADNIKTALSAFNPII
ncbi:MAG: HIT domain-containing protein [Cocleimonas sp.]